ncbi:MAG TPA: hypothetical protein VM639_22320 [Dongiaceae bacterium]|nr:hypothetical protein [Dongiaceae bacterium]
MKFAALMIAVVFGVALTATTASACGYHAATASAQSDASGSEMPTTATTTTTGKTTGG